MKARYDVDGRDGAAAERLVVAKTKSKLRLDELRQFEPLTSGTSRGSAKVISTHYTPIVSSLVYVFTDRGWWNERCTAPHRGGQFQ